MDQYTAADIVDIHVIMENPFVNSAGVGLSNAEIVKLTSSKSIQCNTMKLKRPVLFCL